MKNIIFLIVLFTFTVNAQVGIGTTSPNAQFDITASNQTTPSNTDGLLIPKVDAFPVTNPTASQQAMLVYLTTTSGTNKPGFYYWDNSITTWVSLEAKLVLEDNDHDTKIQVEENTDEDIIRIDVSGKEHYRILSGRIETYNTGNSIFFGQGAGENDDMSNNRNVFLGTNAGNANTTGIDNVAIGFGTFTKATTSKNSIAIGWKALNALTAGDNNTAIGNAVLYVNTTGENNTAIGSSALESNTTGSSNTVIGTSAGNSLTTGKENTLIGYLAGYNNITGDRNIMLGRVAGENATGSKNIFIGNGAGRDEAGDEKLYIDNSNTTTPLIYGDFSTNELTVNGDLIITHGSGEIVYPSWSGFNNTVLLQTYEGFVGNPQVRYTDENTDFFDLGLDGTNNFVIEHNDNNKFLLDSSGNTTIAGNLTINGDGTVLTFPTTDGTSGQVLTTDGAGTINWSDVSIASLLEDSDTDTKIQVEESADEDIIRFDVEGTEYFTINKGRIDVLNTGQSVFIGENAGSNDDFTTNLNTGVGYNSLKANTSGRNNAALGANTLSANTTGFANVALGYNSLKSNNTGDANVAVGSQALQSAVANGNTAVGSYAMDGAVTGDYNTAVGNSTMRSNTSGANNVALGSNSLNANTTGYKNISLGGYSGYFTTTGYQNVFIGYATGYNNPTGSKNTMIGENSGFSNSGSNNVFMGYNSGRNETGSDKLYIENSNSSLPLIYGDFATDELTINGSLTINGGGNVLSFPTVDGTSGQQLKTDGSGNLYWDSSLSSTVISDSDSDTKIQVEEISDEDIIRFDVEGTEYFTINKGRIDVLNTGQSVFIGENAGSNDDFTTNLNTGVGYNSLNTNTSGRNNAALGASSLSSNTTGFANVGVGYNSLKANTTGNANVAFGSQALQSAKANGNTAIGAYTMDGAVTGSNNTTLGTSTMRALTSGGNNVAIGNTALNSVINGSNNVALGAGAGLNATGSSNIFLGNNAGQNETGDDTLYIDNSNTTTPLIHGDFATDEIIINGKTTINDVLNLTPRAIAPTNPNQGDVYFDSIINNLMVYDGAVWQACW